jgi:hypothetical protein
MKTADDLRQEVTKDIHISILKDALADMRFVNMILKKTMYLLCFLLMLAILGIVGVSVYHQHRLFNLMENSEVNSEINMHNETGDYNYMNIERK